MKRRAAVGAGSLDMLLDTMCNTFGGVCFIALLVAILSAMLPKETIPSDDAEPDMERLVEDERLAQLQRRRDELSAAAKLQKDLLADSNTNAIVTASETELVSKLSEKDGAILDLQKKLKGMEEEIAKLATSTDYNKSEAERLRKLAEELRKELEKAKAMRRRTVRTPLERELSGVNPFDLWIRNGRIYVVHDSSQCHCDERGYGDGREWRYTTISGAGTRLDAAYLRSTDFTGVVRRLGGMTYARIFSDHNSFAALCLLRDELVRRGIRYNWYVNNDETLSFIVGRDEKVQ